MEKEPIQVEPQPDPTPAIIANVKNWKDSIKEVSTIKIVIFAIFIISIVVLILIGLGLIVYYLVKTDKSDNSSELYTDRDLEDVDSLLDKYDEELAADEKRLREIRENEKKEILSKSNIVINPPSNIVEVDNTEDNESSVDGSSVEPLNSVEEKIVLETEISYSDKTDDGQMNI